MKIEIEKGIPIPQEATKYPWRSMEVGDSFYTPNKGGRTLISTAEARTGRTFTARREGNGYRIWRIK